MKCDNTYKILIFCLLVLGINSVFSNEIDQNKQADSLLRDSRNRIYENPDKSIALGLSISENTSNSLTNRTRALILVSLAYSSKRDYQNALEYIQRADKLSSELNNKKLQLEILFMTGIIYQQLKIFDKSIEYMERIEKIALTSTQRDSVVRFLANSYIVKGFIYKDNLNCDIALEFFNKGLREYSKLKYANLNANKSIAHYNKGNCYILLSDYENATKSFNQAIIFANLEKANSLISFAEKGLAEVLTLQGEHEKAIELLQSAMEGSKDVGDLVLNYTIFKGLFENYLALNQWDEYHKYYDLYLKTQLELKISERNSISDSIDKSTAALMDNLNDVQKTYHTKVKWVIATTIVLLIIILWGHKKNLKTIQNLKKIVDGL
jgi:tetratricopeptide (TPR) repeat protein